MQSWGGVLSWACAPWPPAAPSTASPADGCGEGAGGSEGDGELFAAGGEAPAGLEVPEGAPDQVACATCFGIEGPAACVIAWTGCRRRLRFMQDVHAGYQPPIPYRQADGAGRDTCPGSAGEAPVTSAWLPRLRVKATALPKPIVRAWILRGGPPRARDGLNFRPPFPAMRITMSLHGATVDARFLGQFRPRKRAPQRYPARDGSSG